MHGTHPPILPHTHMHLATNGNCMHAGVVIDTMVLGIYGSKPTKHKGVARGRGVVYVAINP